MLLPEAKALKGNFINAVGRGLAPADAFASGKSIRERIDPLPTMITGSFIL